MGKRNFALNYTEKELQAWKSYLLQCMNARSFSSTLAKTKDGKVIIQSKDLAKQLESYTLKQLCKKTEKEILILNTENRNRFKELKRCTDVESFFKSYKKLKESQEKIKKLSSYLGNQELALFLTDKMCLELLNDFLRRTSQLNENKSLWFSQVSHHFSEMTEAQIALACTLAKIFENN